MIAIERKNNKNLPYFLFNICKKKFTNKNDKKHINPVSKFQNKNIKIIFDEKINNNNFSDLKFQANSARVNTTGKNLIKLSAKYNSAIRWPTKKNLKKIKPKKLKVDINVLFIVCSKNKNKQKHSKKKIDDKTNDILKILKSFSKNKFIKGDKKFA